MSVLLLLFQAEAQAQFHFCYFFFFSFFFDIYTKYIYISCLVLFCVCGEVYHIYVQCIALGRLEATDCSTDGLTTRTIICDRTRGSMVSVRGGAVGSCGGRWGKWWW